MSVKCKRRLRGFSEDKPSNRRKVLVFEFHKKNAYSDAKRQI